MRSKYIEMPINDKLIKGHLKGRWQLDELFLFHYSVMLLNEILQYALMEILSTCTPRKRGIWKIVSKLKQIRHRKTRSGYRLISNS